MRKYFYFCLTLVLSAGVFWFAYASFFPAGNAPQASFAGSTDVFVKQRADILPRPSRSAPETIMRGIRLPPPLALPPADVELDARLTSAAVVARTNAYREEHGLAPLARNALLDRAAEEKVADMVAKDYFAHESPDGEGAADIMRRVGYEYLIIGENLALGSFADAEDLVGGWMKSDSHRENLLTPSFREIGVAIGQTMREGRMVSIAVQEFGAEEDVCPEPDDALRAVIDRREEELSRMQQALSQFEARLASVDSADDPAEYNTHVDIFNGEVEEYNTRIREQRNDVSLYNAQVVSFNTCIGGL